MTRKNYQIKTMILPVTFFLLMMVPVSSVSPSTPGVDGIFFAKDWEGNGIIIPDMDQTAPNVPAKLYVLLPSGVKCPVEFFRKIETKVIPLGPSSHATCEGGWVYSFIKERCGDFPFVLVSEDFLKQHVPVAVNKGTMKPLSKEEVSRIEKAKKRTVYKSWNIANTENGLTFAVVQFTNPEKGASSCLVLIAQDRLVFEDFGKDYGWMEIDDDETRLKSDDDIDPPDNIGILNVFRSPSGIEIVRRLEGHEGTNAHLMREDGSVFKLVRHGYFYWGPNL